MTEDIDIMTDLLDLTRVTMGELRSLDHPILDEALQRVAEEAKTSVESTAGFQAAI